MNADLFKGKWDKFKGALKQEWKEFTETTGSSQDQGGF